MIKKVIVFLFFSLLTFHLSPVTVYAAGEFATTYDVVYDVGESGVTTVTEKVNLRNLTSEFYANQFRLIIGATQISDIKASDGGGAMQVTTEQKNTSTIITVKFNQQVVGLNKSWDWTLQFKSKDFAEKIGKVWEIRVPKVSETSNLEGYNLTLAVPVLFGDPTIISPTPKSQTTTSGKVFLTFGKDQLKQSGVSASFGNQQLFDFDLSYHLENNNLVPILTSVALPPDTAFQDVIYQRITPTPLNVTVDDDGNYLAWFRLKRSEKMDVKAVGSAKLYTASKIKNPTLDIKLRKQYTQADKYWEKDHPQIIAKLTEILGTNPPQDPAEKAKIIYQYVVNHLKYDPRRLSDPSGGVERLGAVTVLNNPSQAVCMEFTDLFIALARSAGIPTRELNGYAYTSNTTIRPLSLTKDILHSWPEFWDEKKGWIMVDPTWENTTGGVDYFNKLDLNHFTFVVKGVSSGDPIPAGSYKYLGQDFRDVKVDLSDNDFLGSSYLDVQIDAPDPVLAGFPGKIKVKVSNIGNSVYPSNSFLISADKLTILEGDKQKLGPIPSFGQASFELNIRTKSLFDKFNDEIIVLIGSGKYTSSVTVKPFLIFQTYPLMAFGVVLGMIAIYLLVLGGLLYRRKILRISKK